MLTYFATCAKGLESLLFNELEKLGASEIKQTVAGCHFKGEQRVGYQVCLWSRLASRVLLMLDRQPVSNRDDLLEAATAIDWPQLFIPRATFAVDVRGTTQSLTHTQFSARVVKDGVVDRFRADTQTRPNVDAEQPDVQIYVRLARDHATFYLDLSGDSLHKRGYRTAKGAAPIRETLAAAIIYRLGIDLDSPPPVLLDLFAGSGTLLLEAALILTDRAPGLERPYWGFMGWREHTSDLWDEIINDAHQRYKAGYENCKTRFIGVDRDSKVLQAARSNAQALGVDELFSWEEADALTYHPADTDPGWIVSNPPYGERLGNELEVLLMFRQLGQHLRESYSGWQVGLLAPEAMLLKRLKLTSSRKYKLFNGPLEVTLALFDINSSQVEFTKSHSDDLANRLRKNAQKLAKWAKREGTTAYRIYDADIPEYNAAVDVYNDHVVIQEYAAPASIPGAVADDRFWHLLETIPAVLPFSEQQMVIKQRRRQSGSAQYEKQQEEQSVVFEVEEYNARFRVNLSDYLDTGLFIDHRIVRREIQRLAAGKRVLNLFAYTGTASVHAGLGGASHITTVDLSRTYLNWAKDNFRLNHLTIDKHDFIQADCLAWLSEQADSEPAQRWDLIFLDPPTFSNSKRMEESFDVQRDHVAMLKQAMALLAPQGVLIFSTNKRKFKLAVEELEQLNIACDNRSAWSLPEDFKRNPHIHQCWFLRHA